ncbi:uncharacterized protein LOC129598869 [Paramacrobiotus metropolitanus]|uniref:uncharacterized protein LOC129598869 n=1 Tax=Paramacrobiotus metropolitanus TaxID=2943436 RepID=UPI0024456A78|nr:uncharacterized protein LOC129598869 [Paramacrobiotus metropolitanus]
MKAFQFFTVIASLAASSPGQAEDLEVDCHQQSKPDDSSNALAHPVQFAFRTDKLTKTECLTYVALRRNATLCSPVLLARQCNEEAKDALLLHSMSRTYLEGGCSWENRAFFTQLTKNISLISPNRAVTLALKERENADDPLHYDVFDPVRHHLIELTILKCVTPTTTNKIYEAGLLPNVVTLRLDECSNMVIRKRDFSLVSQVRMITFQLCTIAAMEPYTFSDLLHLASLVLESGIGYELYKIHEDPDEIRRELLGKLTDADIAKVHRFHCDCSFSWFRNFLKHKPDLTASKRKGEVAIIGNYMTAFVNTDPFWPDVLSVDCARNLSYESARMGKLFSYNTSCNTPC